MDEVNRGSLNPSAHIREHPGWNEAADRVVPGFEGAQAAEAATHDPKRQLERATLVKTSGFAEAIVDPMD